MCSTKGWRAKTINIKILRPCSMDHREVELSQHQNPSRQLSLQLLQSHKVTDLVVGDEGERVAKQVLPKTRRGPDHHQALPVE